MAISTGDYQFSAAPRTILERQSNYRDTEEVPPSQNIMFDRRVVRGNTYAVMIVPASTKQEMKHQKKLERSRKIRQEEKKHFQQEEESESDSQEESPQEQEPQVEYLDLPDPGTSNLTQGEFFIDKPPTPVYVPPEEGTDQFTQVEDGELFDFDMEVDPILEVLVAKSIEQASVEVSEEANHQNILKHKRNFEQIRNAELLEIQRLENQDNRRQEEATRRDLQAATRRDQMRLAHQKFVCRIVSKRFLQGIATRSLRDLENLGTYADPSVTSLQDQMLPYLLKQASNYEDLETQVQNKIQQLVNSAYKELLQQHKEALHAESSRKEEIRLAEIKQQKETEERKRKRAELRAQRKAEQEKQELKELIEEEIVNSAKPVEGVSSQVIEDSDTRNTQNVLATPGGQFGEFLLMLASIEEASGKELTPETIKKLLEDYAKKMKAPKFVYKNVNKTKLEELYQKLEITQETFQEFPEESEEPFKEFLTNPENLVPFTTVTMLWQNPETLNLRTALFSQVMNALFSLMTAPDPDEDTPNTLREKFVLEGLDWEEEPPQPQAVAIIVPQEDESETTPDKDLMTVPRTERVAAFVLNRVAQEYFREELCTWAGNLSTEELGSLEEVQSVFYGKVKQLETQLLNKYGDLHVFEYHIY
mmetsp:Transcript_9268/g.13771  ORF Transcript_9268/g.13771 Transcript_9268/m.13771 type:complete len:648 (+) Transcript_9268:21-1964(+)